MIWTRASGKFLDPIVWGIDLFEMDWDFLSLLSLINLPMKNLPNASRLRVFKFECQMHDGLFIEIENIKKILWNWICNSISLYIFNNSKYVYFISKQNSTKNHQTDWILYSPEFFIFILLNLRQLILILKCPQVKITWKMDHFHGF